MRVIIVGAGKLGTKLAETMVLDNNMDVTVVEKDMKAIEKISETVDVLTIHGNGIDINILEDLKVNEADLLVACTTEDETNTIVCSLAKQLGCETTIARVRSPEYLKQIEFIKSHMGIDYVINPDLATAKSIERYLFKSHSFQSDGFVSGRVQLLDFNIETMKDFVGKKLMDLEGFEDLLIVAISRGGTLIIPDGETQLEEFDLIYVMGKTESINRLTKRISEGQLPRKVKNLMILGGGKIAYYLAKDLEEKDVNVTIIERDLKTCNKLSEKLNETLIIHGDGTDIKLLEEENISHMDALVGTTDYDETNILMGIVGKQMGVERTIAKTSRENYSRIMDNLDIDAAFNPIHITISSILKVIRGGRIISVSLLIGGEGEVTEIILDKGVSVLDKPLKKLGLPKGMVIGALVRDNKVLIPNGETVLKSKDRIVVFSLKENSEELKRFFKPKKGGILSGIWNGSTSTR